MGVRLSCALLIFSILRNIFGTEWRFATRVWMSSVKENVDLSHGSGDGEHQCSVGKSRSVTIGCERYLPRISVD